MCIGRAMLYDVPKTTMFRAGCSRCSARLDLNLTLSYAQGEDFAQVSYSTLTKFPEQFETK
jgi:hypothetical protein